MKLASKAVKLIGLPGFKKGNNSTSTVAPNEVTNERETLDAILVGLV